MAIKKDRKNYDKCYREKHPSTVKASNEKWKQTHLNYNKNYYQKNRKSILTRSKKYYWKNKEKINDYHKKLYEQNTEQIKKQTRQYYENHKEHCRTRISQYFKTPKGKTTRMRRYNKRRNFDFIPLNSFHEGDEFHHTDEVYGIWMPKKVHRSIYHSVTKNINMDEINAMAFNYINIGGN